MGTGKRDGAADILHFCLTSVLLLPSLGCRGQQGSAAEDSTDLAAREARLNEAKSAPDTGQWGAPLARWVMPQNLNEISGLALTPDGRLFAHPDERAIVSEIDYRRGVSSSSSFSGRRGVQGDFEGIAIAGEVMYLMSQQWKDLRVPGRRQWRHGRVQHSRPGAGQGV